MTKQNTVHAVLALLTLISLGLLTDPFMYWMPERVRLLILVGVTVLLCALFGFALRERASDEREAMHRMLAGRIAYLSGIAVLTVALLVQGLSHRVDPWIGAALAAMVLGKLVAHLYIDHYN